MCIYKRFIFECKHVIWANRVKQCTIGEDYQQRDIVHDCMVKEGHPLLQDCERCVRLKKASKAFWNNIQECRDECTKVILSHPTGEGGGVDVKPMDGEITKNGEDTKNGGKPDAESHQGPETDSATEAHQGSQETKNQNSKPNSTEADQDSHETENQDSKPEVTTEAGQDSQEMDNEDSKPDATAKLDQDFQERDHQDGWIYSHNGRLQSCEREVERDTESPTLPDTKDIQPRTLAEKDDSAVVSPRASLQFRSCIPQQRKTDSRLPEPNVNTRNLGTPSDTKIQINQKPDTTPDKGKETGRITPTLPTLRGIPKPKLITVAVANFRPSPTSQQPVPTIQKPPVGKVMRLPQPIRR
ncbi:unnamed protein product [Clonostachys rosea]|uniref:Uncharacterized protein n=1 Tax=Bionectria ochroleuca TaxID=29856 RepID=A0ABY6UR70_BIOOC|nr:unnamed protein product [Clonostachys rosea]